MAKDSAENASDHDLENFEAYFEGLSSEDKEFANYVDGLGFTNSYLDMNTDVKNSGLHPIIHWLQYGLFEGRPLHSTVVVRRGADAERAEGDNWQHYRWNGELIAVRQSRVALGDLIHRIPDISVEDEAFAEFVLQNLDPEFYLQVRRDVAEANIDPVYHWLQHGLYEGTLLHPDVLTRHGPDAERTKGSSWQRYRWKGELVVVRQSSVALSDLIQRIPDISVEDEAFAEFVLQNLDPKMYLQAHRDVAEINADPFGHWLGWGLYQNRPLHPTIVTRRGSDAERTKDDSWQHYRWKGELIAVRQSGVALGDLIYLIPDISVEDEAFAEFVLQNLDPKMYLQAHRDVAEVNADPFGHWLGWGLYQNRPLHPTIVTRRGSDAERTKDDSWQHYRWKGELIAVRQSRVALGDLIYRIPDISVEDEAFAEFVLQKLDPKMYLQAHRDVAEANIDPFFHWLKYGFSAGFALAPNVKIFKNQQNFQNDTWTRHDFKWNGEFLYAYENMISDDILNQVHRQAKYEPAIYAAGALALSALNVFDGPDLLTRDRVDVDQLLNCFNGQTSVIFFIPYLLAGGAEKYAADLVDVATTIYNGNVSVVVTEQSEKDSDWSSLSVLKPFHKANVIFWKDVDNSYNPVTTLARLLNGLAPKVIVVINSRLGLDLISTYGRGLSQNANLFCAYFSMGVNGLGVPYGTRFPRLTSSFATSLTDNSPMQHILDERYSHISIGNTIVIPPRVQLVSDRKFEERYKKNVTTLNKNNRHRRWVWYSRIEIFKGTEILAKLAKMRPHDQFDVYGTGSENADHLGLHLPNIKLKGVVKNINVEDFSLYDGFIFTSLYEGLPNAVLEMSQHAIPMILSDVGGLRDTFDDESVKFVRIVDDKEVCAKNFDAALAEVLHLKPAERYSMIVNAKSQVELRHSATNHSNTVREKLFNV
ncbi:hypothetical protein DK419_01200 [Methylobacterium terrae]|uniref:Glycosyl transferase family 1 domain-containing protein n=1 Tax=Methylobacterium terrae TaxID=2202827 RepID=A0A2U8WUQ3_9HYPH|nr:glycosyltransferase [Methylobacterium terrae]AWN49789.1 hypothetical protein DK419_01200 [Methylobacterium terrae]